MTTPQAVRLLNSIRNDHRAHDLCRERRIERYTMLVVNVLAGLQVATSWYIIGKVKYICIRAELIYDRPANNSFQKWVDLVGNGSYAFGNLLPYYKKSCTLTAPNTSKRAANSSVTYNPGVFDNSSGLTGLRRCPLWWSKV